MCDHENVTIAHFRRKFWSWLRDAHGEEKVFQTWHKHIRLQDFRTLVAVNVEFLWKESWDIDGQSAGTAEPTALRKHPLWSEIHPDRLKAIPAQPVNYDGLTVVTPFAYYCFQSLYFADMLGMHTVAEELCERVDTRKASLGLTPLCSEDFPAEKLVKMQPLREVVDVQAGDVVVVTADKTGDWKLSTADFWYAYMNQYDFVALKNHHFSCCHQDGFIDRSVVNYTIGDAVLVHTEHDSRGRNCEPAIIVGLFCEQGRDRVLLHRLEYAKGKTEKARPNEVILTGQEYVRPRDDIVRPCQIRVFDRDQVLAGDIPTPYDRDGTGDYFYIAGDRRIAGLALNQSWNPRHDTSGTKLTGLGIFCGGGTFDRGLEEGGAVQFRYAVDLAEKALHSYRANDAEPDRTAYYLGSVNEYLKAAMLSRKRDLVAQPGTVDLISAGSPCQGFSRMQRDQQSDQSRRNASMVASVISYVDVYAPRYLVLENVVAMTNNVKGRGEQNVFSQMIAALVGLGYQVQQFLMDAYYYGSSQGRSRVFIIATAPTCNVLEQPEYTHRRPAHLEKRHSLGRCSNGKPFGSRREDAYTPFAQVSARDSVMDLPVIHDGQPLLCPSYPDHRVATEETATNRLRMAVVPQRPYGMSLVKAAQAGLVRGEPLEYLQGKNRIKCGPASKAYTRVIPDIPFPTILTKLCVGDGINGQSVHWHENRVLTIMEARRAQGYPDYEVLVGTAVDRMKIVGNSVDRKVALVLGLAVRDSWLKSPPVNKVAIIESAADKSPAGLGGAEQDYAEFHTDRTGISAPPFILPYNDYNEEEAAAPADDTTYHGDETWDSPNDSPVDNRSVKMALNLSQHDLESIRIGGFKRIHGLLRAAARQTLQGSSRAGHEEEMMHASNTHVR
ncbi:hypothetical protein CERZMDRAFT_58336 [Cercospora zeae-maydis SCOH1-5]|uniref:DNA (cytosine-5-)-methyltransferase n=1 Tax=Cercospora zeae-maydis SCOH1-5 TaxID=717836 RepID=A0A6A6FJR5_9PEZI|nr:hypothetical protein CERZMDRAFT_58336 [Cercospora zeae-maydis SCOH1-5]